jgi:CRP-like cAMP-binding protein
LAEVSTQGHQDNRLLAALPQDAFATMSRDLRQVSLAQGKSLFEPGAPLNDIYFPQSGMISLMVVTAGGRAVEISTIGREGAVGLHGALGERFSFTRAITQIGGRFSTIPAGRLAQFVREHAPVRELIVRYTELLWAEAQQVAACNAAHDAPARLCRWLLQTSERTGSDRLPLTQELIAEMLVVRRTTVTLLAQSLQRAGAIRYSRGHIEILDREKLKDRACECYSIIQHENLSLKTGVKLGNNAQSAD